MYSRSYYGNEGGRITLPESYDGTAFSESAVPDNGESSAGAVIENGGDKSGQNRNDVLQTSAVGSSLLSGLFGGGSLLGGLNLKMPKIGTEEILIIATAAFLFFSKDGDKESALILLLLLLIG